MSKRFEVLNHQEAKVAGLDVPCDDYKSVLVENMPDGTVRAVAWDYGEPEDNSFRRDWAFVPELLNKLAAESDLLRRAIQNLPDPDNEREEFDTDDLLRGVTEVRKALLPK